jgi:hypothetical protein
MAAPEGKACLEWEFQQKRKALLMQNSAIRDGDRQSERNIKRNERAAEEGWEL